jgi:hypothetical protein
MTSVIICSGCKCKYNDIENDFGYKKLDVPYKTCIKCRNRKKQNNNSLPRERNEKLETYKKYKYWIDNFDMNRVFIEYEDVIEAFKNYNYEVITPSHVEIVGFRSNDIYEVMYDSIKNIERKMSDERCCFIMKYYGDENPFKEMALQELAVKHAIFNIKRHSKNEPVIVVFLQMKEGLYSILLTSVNSIANFSEYMKLKHTKSCNICMSGNKNYYKCYQCNKKYCINCFNKIYLTCPYCNYTLLDHCDKMLEMYNMNDFFI